MQQVPQERVQTYIQLGIAEVIPYNDEDDVVRIGPAA
jgi:hypothetical protein